MTPPELLNYAVKHPVDIKVAFFNGDRRLKNLSSPMVSSPLVEGLLMRVWHDQHGNWWISIDDGQPRGFSQVTMKAHTDWDCIEIIPPECRQRVAVAADYPHTCPRCGAPAYVGFAKVDCSAKCS